MNLKNDKVQIIVMYTLFIAGGIWNVLGWFNDLMEVMASPLLILLGVVLVVKMILQADKELKIRLVLWSLLVIVISMAAEWVGVETGLLFGQYHYGPVLVPKILGVPIAIGFAWQSILLSSFAIQKHFFPRLPVLLVILFIPLIMVVFDFMMEPSAVALNYWIWEQGNVPLLNYFSWYLVGMLLTVLGCCMGLLKIKWPSFFIHAWMSQIIYFILIYLKF